MIKAGIMAISIMSIAGCSGTQNETPIEPKDEQIADSNISASAEAEAEKPEEEMSEAEKPEEVLEEAAEDNPDKDKNSGTAKQDSEGTLGTISSDVMAYFGTTYGEFLQKGGDDAEFLHGGRYISMCPDMDAYVVYQGMWDEDALDYSIVDSSEFLRLEGNISTFFTGTVTELAPEDLIKQLKENYIVSAEYRESAGTAYYVSAEDYLHIELASKDDTDLYAIVEIACVAGETINPDSYCWVMGSTEGSNILAEIPKDFVFSSGAGGWSTDIEISSDGSFVGEYHDSDMGDIGEGYPNGTLYICGFSGKFSKPKPTGKQHIYSMKLLELQIENEDKIGTQEIVDETLYVYSTPYGFEDADEFLIYLPGAPLSEMTEECRSWIFLSDSIFSEVPEGYYVIYNVGGQEAFTGQREDSIWNRNCRYENGTAYVNFSPSYYMGSYLSFFTDEDSPSALALSVPWDGKNTEAMECKKSWDDDGTVVKVTIEPDPESLPRVLKYDITVECISDPQFDFSAWGSSEPGKFSAVFTEKEE